MEFFIDKVDDSIIIKSDLLKKMGFNEIKISEEQIEEIYINKLIKKDFLESITLKNDKELVIFGNNFGIKYLYLLENTKDFVISTLKLKNHIISYIVLIIPRNIFDIISKNFQKFKLKIAQNKD